MKPAFKIVLALAALVLTSNAANHLGGALFVFANKVNPFEHHATLWSWWRSYGEDPAQRRALRGSLLFAALVCFVLPIVLIERTVRKAPSMHGDARFATVREVRKAGLFGDTGIIVGKFAGEFLLLAGQQFALLAAPTRSGKGVGVVIPNLLAFPDSVVVLDIKQENFLITSKYRQRYNNDVYLFNPFAEDGRTARWNPLSYVRNDPKSAVSDALKIAAILFPSDGSSKDTFFAESARNLFVGLVLYLIETPERPRTIGECLRLASGEGSGLKQFLHQTIASRAASERPLSSSCVNALHRFISNADVTLASILGSFTAPLTVWASPVVDAATGGNDFLLSDVRRRRMTIYLGITPDMLTQAAPILNLFFSQLIALNTQELPEANRDLRFQCLLLMDEFTAMGKVRSMESGIAYMAGYNLRFMPIVQSMSQLAGTYGKQNAHTLATNHALRILFPPRENLEAKELSETLGYYTQESTSTSTNSQGGFFKGSSSRGESHSQQQRALMLPQELREMPRDQQIVTFEDTRPILAKKIRYYEDPVFVDRLKEVSPSLAALDHRRWGFWPVRPIPSRAQLKAAISAGELAIDVQPLDISAHMAALGPRQASASSPEVIETIAGAVNTAEVGIEGAIDKDLPDVADPKNPTEAEVACIADALFEKAGQLMRESEGLEPLEPDPAASQPKGKRRTRKSKPGSETPPAKRPLPSGRLDVSAMDSMVAHLKASPMKPTA